MLFCFLRRERKPGQWGKCVNNSRDAKSAAFSANTRLPSTDYTPRANETYGHISGLSASERSASTTHKKIIVVKALKQMGSVVRTSGIPL